MIQFEQWEGFEGRIWKEEVNVRDFIQKNYTPYNGDESFLAGPTEATDKLWGALQQLQKAERAKGGVLDMETEVVSSLTAYGPGYIDEEFAKRFGFADIMPALCNVDYASMELLHAKLVRTTTCVDGCRCDYTICGDKDPYVKEHPEYRDENGYRRNK